MMSAEATDAMLKRPESIVLFVADIDAAAAWYAEIFQTGVLHENAHYALIRAAGVLIGFHPADSKSPGGVGGATVYWEVDDLDAAIAFLQARGAQLYRGPMRTSLGAGAAILRDPFGCTLGIHAPTEASRRAMDALG